MTDDEVRDEVRHWLSANWDPDMDRGRWAHMVVDAGWAVPSWEPEWWGRGVSDAQSRIVAAEFAAVGAPGTAVTTVGTCSPAPCTTSEPTSRSAG